MRVKFPVLQIPSAWNASATVWTSGTKNNIAKKASEGAISR